MGFTLWLHPVFVTQYIRNLPGLSRQARVRLFTNLDANLRAHGDRYIANADLRIPGAPDCFNYELVLQDTEGDGRIRMLRFVVSDAAAAMGVLQVLFVEEL